jgi:hypothetical protein
MSFRIAEYSAQRRHPPDLTCVRPDDAELCLERRTWMQNRLIMSSNDPLPILRVQKVRHHASANRSMRAKSQDGTGLR